MTTFHPIADIPLRIMRLSYIIPLCQLPVRLVDLFEIPPLNATREAFSPRTCVSFVSLKLKTIPLPAQPRFSVVGVFAGI